MKNEIWKDIENYEGSYLVSNCGRIKSLKNGETRKDKILKFIKNKCGYLYVNLYKNNKYKSKTIHRLVAQAFIPNLNNLPQINHIDGNKENNNISNLEWCTRSENIKHAYKNGLHKINKHNERKVKQIDVENGIILNVFDSVRQIEKILGFSSTNISKCCRKEKNHNTAYGYNWEYIDEVNKLKENNEPR